MSIWGEGEKITLELIKTLPSGGRWLDLAAGDGRYVPELLEKVNELVVADIDYSMLMNIQNNVISAGKHKLEIKVMDLTNKFPFKETEFDGIFCTGTLHLFSEGELKGIFKEIDRVLKQGGTFIFDFACDYQRLSANGQIVKLEKDQGHSLKGVQNFVKSQLENYQIDFRQDEWEEDLTKNPDYGYKTIGKFLLIKAIKK